MIFILFCFSPLSPFSLFCNNQTTTTMMMMTTKQIEIDHILEASSAQRTSHTSAHSRGAVLDLFMDSRVSERIDRLQMVCAYFGNNWIC